MGKIDFRKTWPERYQAPRERFIRLVVPPLHYVMIDGQGNPNTALSHGLAIGWLYSVSYAMKFLAKDRLGQDYVVPPLEGLWWADDPADFVRRQKDRWRWTMMIPAPDFTGPELFSEALGKATGKLGAPPRSLRREVLDEGLSLQILHLGSYDDEGPVLARLHDEIMPAQGLTFAGRHHEIYLNDPRRTAPAKLKTILRQPVRPRG